MKHMTSLERLSLSHDRYSSPLFDAPSPITLPIKRLSLGFGFELSTGWGFFRTICSALKAPTLDFIHLHSGVHWLDDDNIDARRMLSPSWGSPTTLSIDIPKARRKHIEAMRALFPSVKHLVVRTSTREIRDEVRGTEGTIVSHDWWAELLSLDLTLVMDSSVPFPAIIGDSFLRRCQGQAASPIGFSFVLRFEPDRYWKHFSEGHISDLSQRLHALAEEYQWLSVEVYTSSETPERE
jgi:hypothetical protein